ncbi:MAG: hypothetical protein ABIH65_01155 [Nanoarchaeota archaeon]
MSFGEITSFVTRNFTVSEGIDLIKPLGLFIIGLAIYVWFIFKFYRLLARREIFKLDIDEKKHYGKFKSFLLRFIYLIRYIVIFPVFLLFWVLILSVILAFLSKNTPIEGILLIAVALVGVIRFMTYYNEDLSRDLAKMMPFALLGVFLVDASYFVTTNSIEKIWQFFDLWKLIVYYLIVIILMEFVLRTLRGIVNSIKNRGKKED